MAESGRAIVCAAADVAGAAAQVTPEPAQAAAIAAASAPQVDERAPGLFDAQGLAAVENSTAQDASPASEAADTAGAADEVAQDEAADSRGVEDSAPSRSA